MPGYHQPSGRRDQPQAGPCFLIAEVRSLKVVRRKESTVNCRFDEPEESQFEETRFDELAMALAGGVSRRDALRRIGGGLAGALLASLGLSKSWGAPNPPGTGTGTGCGNVCQAATGFNPNDKGQTATKAAYNACVKACDACTTSGGNPCIAAGGGVECCTGDQVCCNSHCAHTTCTVTGQTFNSTTCQCECPAGTEVCGGNCVSFCPSPTTRLPDCTCACPAPPPSPMTYAGVTISNVSVNGGGSVATVAAGSTVAVSLDFNITDCPCPTCIDQINYGFANDAAATGCFYDGIPGCTGDSGSAGFNVTAPATPGIYYLAFDRAEDFCCFCNCPGGASACWWTGSPAANPDRWFAALCVV